MNSIWVISDVQETSYELISKAKELLEGKEGKITAFISGDENTGQEAVKYGADVVKLMEIPSNTTWEQYIPALVEEGKASNPQLILVSATRRGKDLAAQLGALLECPCITECKTIELKNESLQFKRIVYGGLAEKIMESKEFPIIATVAARNFPKSENPDESRQGEITKLALPEESKLKVVERRPKPKETVNISEANVVIGVGRGFSDESELKIAEELAQVLGGEVGCTRPIAEDLRWLPEDRYIGISGQVVRPTLYLCAGVSGQVQHVYGIRDSKLIVAVDKNENAPIFQVADYYIVGDLKEVLPILTEEVKKVKGSN